MNHDFCPVQFHDLADDLIKNAQSRHQAIEEAMYTMGLTTHAMSHGQTWPYVTLPDFDLWTNPASIGATSVSLVVLAKNRTAWSKYSQSHVNMWVPEGGPFDLITPFIWKPSDESSLGMSGPISLPAMMILDSQDSFIRDDSNGVAGVAWQSTSPVDPRSINYNQLSSPFLKSAVDRMMATMLPVQWTAWELPGSAFILQPVISAGSTVVGYLFNELPWSVYFEGQGETTIPLSAQGIACIIQDTCQGHLIEVDLYGNDETRSIDGERLRQLQSSSKMMVEASLHVNASVTVDDKCTSPILLQIYATGAFMGPNEGDAMDPPKLAAATGIFVGLVCLLCFLVYDSIVRRKQEKLAHTAKKSLEIVNSLFPATVRDRLMEKDGNSSGDRIGMNRASTGGISKRSQIGKPSRVASIFQSMAETIAPTINESFAEDTDTRASFSTSYLIKKIKRKMTSRPIADLFPQVSVLFADIAGFTAWSSVREPSQVFTLLESIFETFDAIAKRHKVFKVETIGDCYVAASGMPDPCADHG